VYYWDNPSASTPGRCAAAVLDMGNILGRQPPARARSGARSLHALVQVAQLGTPIHSARLRGCDGAEQEGARYAGVRVC